MTALPMWLKKISPQHFFLVAGIISGLILIFITPPFQSPDEVNHFYRIWQISEGQFSGVKHDSRVGGFLPEEFDSLTKPFAEIRFADHPQIPENLIARQMNIQLSGKKRFYDFPNTAVYNPVIYLPQAIFTAIFRTAGLSALKIYYGVKILSLLFWVFIVFSAIKRLPFFRWLFTILALLPMSVFINSSLSADVMINCAAFLFLASVLQIVHHKTIIRQKHILLFILFTIWICTAKMVYSPLLLLLLLIPVSQFGSRAKFIIAGAGVILVLGITSYILTKESAKIYTPYARYHPEHRNGIDLIVNADLNEQMKWMKQHPASFATVFTKSVTGNAQDFASSYIGRLGWYTIKAPVWYILAAYLFLTLAILKSGDSLIFSRKQIVLMLVSFASTLYLIIISQHLTWNPLGAERVTILQGRYFIPVFPLLFLAAGSLPLRRISIHNRWMMLFALAGPVMAIYMIAEWFL